VAQERPRLQREGAVMCGFHLSPASIACRVISWVMGSIISVVVPSYTYCRLVAYLPVGPSQGNMFFRNVDELYDFASPEDSAICCYSCEHTNPRHLLTIRNVGTVHCLVFSFKARLSETGFCLHLQVEPAQLGPIQIAGSILKTDTELSLRNIAFVNKREADG
jgi:hypothetical protein